MHLLKYLLRIRLYALCAAVFIFASAGSPGPSPAESLLLTKPAPALFDELCLADYGLKKEILDSAVKGYNKLHGRISQPVLSIVDFSQPSSSKRLYIIDLKAKKLLFHTYVAHGKNSGEQFASSFSNIHESYQSSLGFYVTGNVYSGKHGVSLKLKGLNDGLNTNAEQRAIVLHGAEYVSEDFIQKHGRLGRSFGCPAVSQELAEPIIEEIKNGSCLYIYHPESHFTVCRL